MNKKILTSKDIIRDILSFYKENMKYLAEKKEVWSNSKNIATYLMNLAIFINELYYLECIISNLFILQMRKNGGILK